MKVKVIRWFSLEKIDFLFTINQAKRKTLLFHFIHSKYDDDDDGCYWIVCFTFVFFLFVHELYNVIDVFYFSFVYNL